MATEIVNSSEFFSERSSLKGSPNFKSVKADTENIISLNEKKNNSSRGNAYKHTKTGFREDIGLNLRSNWEANFVRVLNGYKIKFEFEPIKHIESHFADALISKLCHVFMAL